MSQFPGAENADQVPPPPPAAPPTAPGMLAIPDRPAAWPSVVGIICIVFGALGVIGGMWGIGSNVMMMLGTMPVQTMGAGPAGPELLPLIKSMMPFIVAGEALKFLLGIALIVVGWLMHARRPMARPAAVWWSLAKIFATIAGTAYAGWMQYVIMMEVTRMMAEDPNAPPQMQGVMTGVMVATIAMTVIWSLAWGCALPAFLLIWFSRAKVKAEVGRWASRQHGRIS
ncbi:MAG: hypothetical protein KF699_04040 [Phycisphaeraceae bacterium]|nr:hypothetical protein [Phycisphaeraceae bacterium]